MTRHWGSQGPSHVIRDQRKTMEKCLFCENDLAPGSEEHVFLSALGGRIATSRALCPDCNNSFATRATGKLDDHVAEGFKDVRNVLKIWSGRGKPPPTLPKAGSFANGPEFDLAPGFVPVARRGRLPEAIKVGDVVQITAVDEADLNRQLEILRKRGIAYQLGTPTQEHRKAPTIKRSFEFDNPKTWRAVAKTAVTSFVVLFGNAQARGSISLDLRNAIRHGSPAIDNFAGWDFSNPWPEIESIVPDPRTLDALPSGFEHSVIIADVGQGCIGYVALFGGWRFSVLLGPRTGLPTRALAANPRSAKPARFLVTAKAPAGYARRHSGSFKLEHSVVMEGVTSAFNRALEQWNSEANTDYAEALAKELGEKVEAAGEDESARAAAIDQFAEKVAAIELGVGWSENLSLTLDEDAAPPAAWQRTGNASDI
jgi:HNH endonuclease